MKTKPKPKRRLLPRTVVAAGRDTEEFVAQLLDQVFDLHAPELAGDPSHVLKLRDEIANATRRVATRFAQPRKERVPSERVILTLQEMAQEMNPRSGGVAGECPFDSDFLALARWLKLPSGVVPWGYRPARRFVGPAKAAESVAARLGEKPDTVYRRYTRQRR